MIWLTLRNVARNDVVLNSSFRCYFGRGGLLSGTVADSGGNMIRGVHAPDLGSETEARMME